MSKQVVILSGVSGSGKSTLAQNLIAGCHVQNPTFSKTVSADHFFMVDEMGHRGELDGKYQFDASKLGEAHAFCFRNFIDVMQEVHDFTHTDGEVVHLPNNLIIVDNTGTTESELSPYILGASAFGYEAEVITIVPDTSKISVEGFLEKCAQRNKHNVPLSVIQAQYRRIASRRLPSYWKASTREMKG